MSEQTSTEATRNYSKEDAPQDEVSVGAVITPIAPGNIEKFDKTEAASVTIWAGSQGKWSSMDTKLATSGVSNGISVPDVIALSGSSHGKFSYVADFKFSDLAYFSINVTHGLLVNCDYNSAKEQIAVYTGKFVGSLDDNFFITIKLWS